MLGTRQRMAATPFHYELDGGWLTGLSLFFSVLGKWRIDCRKQLGACLLSCEIDKHNSPSFFKEK